MPLNNQLLIEPHYFPCIAYFACLSARDPVVLEAHEHYAKQSYRNRCQVRAANKVVSLSVPVVKSDGKQKMGDVRIDYRDNWLKDHWRTIVSAYGKTPFFGEFAPVFETVLFAKPPLLLDLNKEILTKCLHLLGWQRTISVSEQYLEGDVAQGSNGSQDWRNMIHPKKTATLARIYRPVAYPQNFGGGFAPNLSVLDLLFCEGPIAGHIIRQSACLDGS